MLFIVGAFLAYLALISYRGFVFVPPVPAHERRYRLVLAGCLIADLTAAYGFYVLVRETPSQIGNYTLIVTALALLAAVAIIAKFAFPRERSAPYRRLSAWALSVLVTSVLYLLFGSISYYAKIVRDTNLSVAYLFIPAVMLAILWINTVYDHWDSAERSE